MELEDLKMYDGNISNRREGGRQRPVRSMRRLLASSLLAGMLAGGGAAATQLDPDVVDIDTARAQLETGAAIVIDIREPRETANGVAAGVLLVPLSEMNQRIGEIPRSPAKPVFIICNSQNRSIALLRALRQAGGYAHVRYVAGGMAEWVRRGWPTVKPAV